MNPQSGNLGVPHSTTCVLIVARLFHDLRVAQIQPIAGVEILAEVDDDFQPFCAGNFDIDWLCLIASDFRFEQRAVVGEYGQPHIAA